MNPARLQFSINGVPLGNVFVAGNAVCEWRQFFQIWDSEDNTTAEICIINQNTNPAGNDFALDDFAFYELDSIIYDTFYVEIESLIAAKERRVYIPNAFSPNEDGFNDLFIINTGKGIEEVESIKIFDRWGNLIFTEERCSGGDCGWNGLINNSPAAEGTYIYAANIKFSDGVNETFTGSLQLMR
jgi:gliding motility-associated-like protein